MTTTTRITLDNVDSISPRDLRDEARRSLESVAETGRDASGGVLRVTNGNAVWGDWDPTTETLTTDDAIRVHLDGREEE